MSPARVLLTGASGFVGGHLARRLVARGTEVVALTRPGSHRPVTAGVTAVPTPADQADLSALVREVSPGACVHLATLYRAQHRPEEVVDLVASNVTLGARLAEALAPAGVPLVDVGTVWQHVDGAPYRPANLYAATKQALADILVAYALRHDLAVVRLTLTDTYGPGDDRPRLLPALLDAATSGEPIELSSGHQLVDLAHVTDVVAAFEAVLDGLDGPAPTLVPAPDGTTRFGVSSRAPVTVRDLVATVERVTGRRIDARWGARPDRAVEMRSPWDPGPPVPGWQPQVGLADGIAALLDAAG